MEKTDEITNEKKEASTFLVQSTMESLIDKLKILKYESEFLSLVKLKPINRFYFLTVKNTGEQFFMFTSLAAWLIRKCGKSIEPPQEYDDPNTTIVNILNVLREMGIAVDFPPNKLRQGAGEHVIMVLEQLANQALAFIGFSFEEPKIAEDEEEDIEVIEDEAEINLERIEEEMMAAYSDDSEEENIFHQSSANSTRGHQKAEYDLYSNTDTEAWKEELERVLPQLKVTIKNDNRDWRSHFEQIRTYRSNIEQPLNLTKTNLGKLQNEISLTLEKIATRERYLNKELEPIMDEYRLLQDQLSKVKESYREINGGVMERTRQLASLADKMETIKQQMEEQGSAMTDGTPLINIKKAITKVAQEVSEMDVRIGVLSCLLLQSKIREKNMLEQDLYQTTKLN